jgi:hypothetical protein
MKAIEFRDLTFEGLKGSLDARRWEVYGAWTEHGPGTTREVAARSGIDLLALRPRTTELVQMGLVRVRGAHNKEGVYEVVPSAEWERWRAENFPVSGQQPLL